MPNFANRSPAGKLQVTCRRLQVTARKLMPELLCPHCQSTFKRQDNLNVHIKDRCPVLKATIAMSLVRVGRAEEREENGGTKKRSKSPRHYDDYDDMESTEASQFEIETAKDIFTRLSDGRIADFKATYDIQVQVVQALLQDKFSKERLSYLRKKNDFEGVYNRFNTIDRGFTQLNAPAAAPTVSISNTTNTTAATSNSTGGIFGGMFNSQNFTTTSNANA